MTVAMPRKSFEATYLTARAAAARLKVTPATLYAYVSRGLVRSEPGAGRERRYRAEDIETLARRRAGDASAALDWGAPVLDSAITAIAGDRLLYRGIDALRLAREASVRSVAELLWQAEGSEIFSAENVPPMGPIFLAAAAAARGLPPIERSLALLPHAAAEDPRASDLAPAAVARTGARLLRLLAAVIAGSSPSPRPVDAVLSDVWNAGTEGRQLLRAALVLCADHELNVSAFTVRCVASAGAAPHLAVLAGLAALRGRLHGGATERAGVFLENALQFADVGRALAERLQRGESFPGFGHPLYPSGDPRARLLLALLHEVRSDAAERARQIATAIAELTGRAPNIDWALAVLGRHLDLPPGATLGLFALGRTLGWIAHAQEQYASGRLIRPRARYVGPAAVEVPKSAGVERTRSA